MPEEKTIRYHLNDEGQDLVAIDIQGSKIVGVHIPSLNHLYVGLESYDYWAQKKLKKGGKIRYSKGPGDGVFTIKYPIVKIEELIGSHS